MSVPCEEIRPELEALLAAMIDGRLEPDGRRRLNAILREHPDARQFYLDYCQMHALLQEAHGELHALQVPRPGRRIALGAVAAAALVAVGLFGWLRREGPAPLDAQVAAAEGTAWVVRGSRRVPVAEAREMRDGDRVSTGAASRTEVRSRDGSTIALLDLTEAEFRTAESGGRIELVGGTLRCDIRPQPAGKSLVFATRHAEATVLGTSFELNSDSRETRLRMADGRVRMTSEGRSIEVKAGELGTADAQGLVRWEPVCDLKFAGMKELPAKMETWFCLSETHLTPTREIVRAPDRVHLVEGGLVLGPVPGGGHKHGLVESRWTEEVGDNVLIEADVAAGPRWSLGFAVSGSSFDGYRIIFAAMDSYPNGIGIDTIQGGRHIVLAVDPRPVDYGKDHTIRVERHGTRMRVWIDAQIRIDTEIVHPLPEDRKRTFSLSNFGGPPVLRALRVWKEAKP